jgi:Carboxypeptidase regulatory-like domain
MIQSRPSRVLVRWPVIWLFFCCPWVVAQTQPAPDSLSAQNALASDQPSSQPPSAGTISGRVVDQAGNFIVSAVLMLVPEGHTEVHTKSNAEGRFIFPNAPAGPFELDISAPGFAVLQVDGVLHPGETQEMLDLAISIAAATTEVQVSGADHFELAEEQIKVQETQRVLGVIPNFYVTYDPNALSLNSRQKFELAWKSSVDPVTFAASGAIAGVQQASDGFAGYGQGTQGFAKRFAASYADAFIGNMIGGAILPSVLKQDPRYFYKGTGPVHSRILYALANAVVCKGDNGRWQPDYSGIVGSLAAGGISNLYYPAKSRNGAGLTFENTLLGIAGSGIGNLFQEFLVRKLTPHARDPQYHAP